ncbi:rab-protein geranylgeranyltransferase [Stereum hirsutum FP-91666 SS1]|uniref:rab-protein geranylgeranyltransferase n=1 Tax=Stereum hirsutum (strain FP-91666) TaxID=721885 RepID=UPI000440D429|nr:rab-protein geranylgeranyltransferase [Stereum hirsutum FP-91666 SS1]EIM90234.1 rab-protein geranylgeranyltransferase [Stereum hirsutum FP-91666 SS1]
MHGVRRVRQSREAQEAKQERDKAKLVAYLALTDDVLARKKSQDWSQDAFDLTSRLLSTNPEFYTVWNYRRNILLRGIFLVSSAKEIYELLTNDLAMTTIALKAHPKVYWIWNHRRWCLESIPDGGDGDDTQGWKKTSWQREMGLVEKMLEADARNFHAWNYRRYVLAGMPVRWSEIAELGFTTKKIESNFSNFSAWHQRTKILSSLWDSGKLNRAATLQQEFDLVQNAMYTDPNDQSVWLYHRWLVGTGDDRELLEREIVVIQELLDEQPDSKWCMESLVHYKQLLLRNHSTSIGEGGSQVLVKECLQLLDQLESIDPQRRRRYQQLANEVKR